MFHKAPLPLLVNMLVNCVKIPREHKEESQKWSQVEHVESAHGNEIEHANMNWPNANVPHFFDPLQSIDLPDEQRD